MNSWKSSPLIKFLFKKKDNAESIESSNYNAYSLYSTHPAPCFGCSLRESCPDAVFIKQVTRLSRKCIPALKAEIEWLDDRSTERMIQVTDIQRLPLKG